MIKLITGLYPQSTLNIFATVLALLLAVSLPLPADPVGDPVPPSTLLPPGSSSFSLQVTTDQDSDCRWSQGPALPWEQMTPFDSGAGGTTHQTLVSGLTTDPNTVNDVYVRCASDPGFLLSLRYRSLSDVNPSFPRTGNLWGHMDFDNRPMEELAHIDLWMGLYLDPSEIRQLRQLNPDIRVLTSISTVENMDAPESFLLLDVDKNPVETWPGIFRLNVTRPEVAEYQANFAAQRILDSELMYDGCFFDNVMTTISWQTHDAYGKPIRYDHDEDGKEDDPAVLDAAWKAGVFHELETFRQLMPHALVTGHMQYIYEAGIAEIFNAKSFGFYAPEVIEGRMEVWDFWDRYTAWQTMAQLPHFTMIESAPPDQIGYGYGFAPWDDCPPATIEFARTYYPYVRFGLAFSMLEDGYFAHEFGDMWHGNDWWYNELDFDLGYPLGPASWVEPGGPELLVNGGFESGVGWPWALWVNSGAGAAATLTQDITDAAEGAASARVEISAASGTDWHVDLAQWERSLEAGVTYDLRFMAKADSARRIRVAASKGAPDWDSYGLSERIHLTTDWAEHLAVFTATATADDARIHFFFGEDEAGTVWIDDVRLTQRPPDLLQREFDNGLVLLNATTESREVSPGPGYRRLSGSQAPLVEYIVDDQDAAFSAVGTWTSETYDSGEWVAGGPYYHDWGPGCMQSSGFLTQARWDLELPLADSYTITAWWPAAPEAAGWSPNVLFEVVSGGSIVASATLDQTSGGDQWQTIATDVTLDQLTDTHVRARSTDGLPCIADALHVRSAARYNNGGPVTTVTLRPMDGILLERYTPSTITAALDCQPASGTVPFSTTMSLELHNMTSDHTRRIAGRLNVKLAGGQSYPGWRAGYTNVAGGESYLTSWVTTIPALGSVIGANQFTLVAEDVTPPPYNQPPYPAAGDTASDICTVTGNQDTVSP